MHGEENHWYWQGKWRTKKLKSEIRIIQGCFYLVVPRPTGLSFGDWTRSSTFPLVTSQTRMTTWMFSMLSHPLMYSVNVVFALFLNNASEHFSLLYLNDTEHDLWIKISVHWPMAKLSMFTGNSFPSTVADSHILHLQATFSPSQINLSPAT